MPGSCAIPTSSARILKTPLKEKLPMIQVKKYFIASLLCASFAFPAISFADTCTPVEDCLSNAIPTTLATCEAATPACTVTNKGDQYAVSAETIAARAVAIQKCDVRTFKFKAVCNSCYQLAKAPLASRYDGKLFHGLLGQAVKDIEALKLAKCANLK